MELNKELLTKAKAAKTTEELLALAKENGIEMTAEEAQKILRSSTRRAASLPTRSWTMSPAAAAVPPIMKHVWQTAIARTISALAAARWVLSCATANCAVRDVLPTIQGVGTA